MERQKPISFSYEGVVFNEGFRAETFKEGLRRVVNNHADFASSRLRVRQLPVGEAPK